MKPYEPTVENDEMNAWPAQSIPETLGEVVDEYERLHMTTVISGDGTTTFGERAKVERLEYPMEPPC